MNKFKKFLSTILFSCLFLITIQGTAYAANYILEGFGQSTSTISVYSSGMLTYRLQWLNAISAWNNSWSGINLSDNQFSYDPNHRIYESPVNDTWYGCNGQYNPLPSGRSTSFFIIINTTTCTSSSVQSTIVHELGHILNLNDYNMAVSPNNAIMNCYRDRTVLKTPTSNDIAGVMASY